MAERRIVYVLVVYLCTRCYGGPEEGGWYFNCGDLVRIIGTYKDEDVARARRNRLQRLIKWSLNKPRTRRERAVDNGIYEARLCEDFAPVRFPTQRPEYGRRPSHAQLS